MSPCTLGIAQFQFPQRGHDQPGDVAADLGIAEVQHRELGRIQLADIPTRSRMLQIQRSQARTGNGGNIRVQVGVSIKVQQRQVRQVQPLWQCAVQVI